MMSTIVLTALAFIVLLPSAILMFAGPFVLFWYMSKDGYDGLFAWIFVILWCVMSLAFILDGIWFAIKWVGVL